MERKMRIMISKEAEKQNRLPKYINNPAFFLLILLAVELIYMVWMACTASQHMNSYFHINPQDTFMDWFNMLYVAGTDHASIYEAEKPIYPALCFAFWSILYALIPEPYRGIGSFELRNLQQPMLGFVIMLLLTGVLLWELFQKGYGRSGVENKLFALAMMMSGPMVFAIERGNIILLAFTFALVFILFYNSGNKYLRYLSYIALALSAAVKIYPALFGLLIIERKRWKEALIAVIIGAAFFVLPFLEFGGISSVAALFQNILTASPELANRGCGYNFSFANLMKIMQILSEGAVSGQAGILRIFPVCVTFFIYFASKEEWKKICAIVLFIVWVPEFSYTYTLLFFMLPFVSFLKTLKKMTTREVLYMLLFMFIFLPTATELLPKLDSAGVPYPISGSVIITNAGIVTLSLLLISDGIINLVVKHRGGWRPVKSAVADGPERIDKYSEEKVLWCRV